MNKLLTAIKAVAPDAAATHSAAVSRTEPDTIDVARAKVVAKLNENIMFFKKGACGKKPDLVYKPNSRDGTYFVGAKYGNRWIEGLGDSGEKFIENINREQLVHVLEEISKHVDSGGLDAGISSIQKRNLEARRGV